MKSLNNTIYRFIYENPVRLTGAIKWERIMGDIASDIVSVGKATI